MWNLVSRTNSRGGWAVRATSAWCRRRASPARRPVLARRPMSVVTVCGRRLPCGPKARAARRSAAISAAEKRCGWGRTARCFNDRRRDDAVSPQPLSEAVGGVKVAADLSRTIACLAEGRDEAVQVGTERASLKSSADVGPDPVRVEHDLLLSRDRWWEETGTGAPP